MEYEIYKGEDELLHWGIKGMRWGVRRYQNKDGSLTPAGKKRVKAETTALKKEAEVLKNRKATKAKFDRLAAKRKALEDEKKALDEEEGLTTKKGKKGAKESTKDVAPAKKSIKDMTDDELVAAVNRARLEEAYKQYHPVVEKHPLMKKVINEAIIPAAVNSGKQILENTMKDMAAKALKGKVDPNSLEALTAVRDKLKVQTEIAEYKMGGKFNWENMLKKQTYEKNVADQDARSRGFKSADDERNHNLQAEAAARKAKADEAARAANEDTSRRYYESTYSNKGGESTRVGPQEERGLTVYNPPKTAMSLVKSAVNKSSNSPVTSLSTTVVNNGKKAVDDTSEFIRVDKDGSILRRWDD